MQPESTIAAISKLLGGRPLHPAPPRFDGDTVAAVMPERTDQPLRYALRDGRLAGLNLAGAGLDDAQWQAIRALEGFDPARIEALNLRGNQLTVSPAAGMNALKWLDLSDNQLREFVPPAGALARLEHLWLSGNPDLATPPPEIVAQGRYALLQYFKSIAKSVKRLYEAKMLILGEGGAGKTSLARRLIDRAAPMPGDNESTRGIDILHYSFVTPAGDTFLLKLWDFAGQDIYHATHQFFLTKRSLYVLVDNTRYSTTEAPDNLFYYWFRVAELYGDNSPLLLVQNEIADRSKDINFTGFQTTFPFIEGRFPVNIDTNRGLDAVAEAVMACAMRLPHVGEIWPETWAAARQALETRAAQENYVNYETYIQAVAAQGVTDEAEARVLSGFLHDLGVLLHFKDDERLRDLVILRNQWATDAVYKVLDHERVKNRFGQFTQADIDAIWSAPEYAFRKKELLALMERFELCYALKDAPEPTWLATQLLPEQAPKVPWDQHHNTAVRYDFGFMPKGLIPRFIVRNNQYVGNIGRAWKYGVEMTCGPTAAKITASYADNTIEIRVNDRGDYGAFLALLCDDMDRLLAGFGDKLVVEKMLPCPCTACAGDPDPYFFKYSLLRRRIEVLKKPTIECGKSGLDIEVQPFLAAFFGKTAGAKKVFVSYAHDQLPAAKRLKTALAVQEKKGKIDFWYDQDIRPGTRWEAEIEAKIGEADIIVLLLSPEFWASGFIWDKELPLVEARQRAGARVLCVMLSDNDFQDTQWSALQAVPQLDGRLTPISRWPNQDAAWQAVVAAVKGMVV